LRSRGCEMSELVSTNKRSTTRVRAKQLDTFPEGSLYKYLVSPNTRTMSQQENNQQDMSNLQVSI
jgi:hypothetical protein